MPTSPYPMIAPDDALAAILDRVLPLAARTQPLRTARGAVLATPVHARDPMPPFAAAAVDGYAVRTSDVPGVLRIVGEAAAGAPAGVAIGPGTSVRIATGAPVPEGATAVAMVEDSSESPGAPNGSPPAVEIRVALAPGQGIRPVGCDYAAGEAVLPAGTVLGPPHLGLLASLGIDPVSTIARPRVALLSSGDELVPPEQTPGPGQIRDSNRVALAAAVEEAGGVAVDAGHLADTPDALSSLAAAVADADALVTSGGVSMGRRDLIKPWLADRGEVVFGRIRVKPGKPMTFALVDGVPIFALPGFPVSALVTFELFVRPALRAMAGRPDLTRPRWPVRLEHEVGHDPERVEFQRARVRIGPDGPQASTTGAQGSGRLLSLARANALLRLEGSAGTFHAGAIVEALILGPVGTLESAGWPEAAPCVEAPA